MGGFETIDEGILAGALIDNGDIAADAAISPLKIEKRTILVPCYFAGAVFTGAGVAITIPAYAGILVPNANAGTINASICSPRGEIAPGEKGTIHIWWHAATTSVAVRFVVDIKPIISGVSNLASAITKTVISVPTGSGLETDARIVIPYAILANNQLLGIQIYRDPDNTLDTLAADAIIDCIYLEVLGRC